jgi:ABC-type bacteriocin/lantibiotic exporter with double-glycine peptidase domain
MIFCSSAVFGRDDVNFRYCMPETSRLCCGADALYVCARALGTDDVNLAKLEKQLPLGPRGIALESLIEAANDIGIRASAYHMNPAKVKYLGNPEILHVNDNHYIALLGADGDHLIIFDNGTGLYDCTQEFFAAHYRWSGTAIILGFPSPYVAALTYGRPFCLVAGCLVFAWLLSKSVTLRRLFAKVIRFLSSKNAAEPVG